MQKERNMSEYIDFITYQDDAICQCALRYYRRRGKTHPQPNGDLHQGNRHRENLSFSPPKESGHFRSLRISDYQNIPLSYKIRLNQVRPANKIHP